MRIALLGYGKMGKMIERIAIERGHEIVLIVDENNRAACTDEQLKQADVAIEFTMPAVAVENYKWCFDNGVPVVSGTTGWLERWLPGTTRWIFLCLEFQYRGEYFLSAQ